MWLQVVVVFCTTTSMFNFVNTLELLGSTTLREWDRKYFIEYKRYDYV